MKKVIFCTALTFVNYLGFAQVGINTTTANATLDIQGKATTTTIPDGVIPPRITLAQLNAKTGYGANQTGSIIYVTSITGGSTVSATSLVVAPGFYYFDGTKWQAMVSKAGSVIFTITTGHGVGGENNGTIYNGGGFQTVALSTIGKNIGGGTWDSTNNTYTIPASGTYLIKASIRTQDDGPSTQLYEYVGVENADKPDGIWVQTPSSGRFTLPYVRFAYFTAGDKIKLVSYSDGNTVNYSDAALNIASVSQN